LCPFDFFQVCTAVVQQRGQSCSLKRQRRSLGIMFVIGLGDGNPGIDVIDVTAQ
jgi:hypothetical protein